MLNRRNLLKAGAFMATTSMVPWSTARAADDKVTFVSWGGSTQEAQTEAWATPFTAATQIPVVQDGPTDYGKLKAMVESGNVMWDVVDVEGYYAYRFAKLGLLEPIDYTVVNRDDLDPRLAFEYGVGSFMSSYVLAYNKNFVQGELTTWADLFDIQKFPGKRAVYKWAGIGPLEMALLADGVEPSKLYPLDLDRAFAKLDTIKSNIVWWGSGAESQQLIASGEAPIGMFWNGRIYFMQKDGLDSLAVSWKQNIPGPDILVVPKGAPNKAAAMKFIAEAASARGQATFANLSAYAPTNSAAIPLIKPEILPVMPFTYKNEDVPLGLEYWSENVDEISKRWYAWQSA